MDEFEVRKLIDNQSCQMATEYRELNAVIKAIWGVKVTPNAEIFNALKKAIEEEVKNIEPADVWPVNNRYIDGDELFKCIAGHSYYSGDDILTRICMMQEGKLPKKKDIEPANASPVVCGEWIELHEHRWKKYDGSDEIDTFAGVDFGFHNGPLCIKCGLSFCEHCEPEKYLSVCPVPNYKCSICGHESDTNSPFCPACGADMRKKNEQ